MTTIHRRKQPEKVRRQLLDAAARVATLRGTAAVTVEAVCVAAGVTKGAFFHHFPAKADLIDAVFSDLLDRFDLSLAESMAADPEPYGRFTRAYLDVVSAPGTAGSEPLWAALYFSAHTQGSLRQAWKNWLAERLAAHGEPADDLALTVVRLAADGLWLAAIDGGQGPAGGQAALLSYLKALTYLKPGPGANHRRMS